MKTTAFTKLSVSRSTSPYSLFVDSMVEDEKILLWFYSGTHRSPEPCCATIDQTSNEISTAGSLTSTPQASSVTGYLYQSDLRMMNKQKMLREHDIDDQGRCPTRLSVASEQAS